MFLEVILLLPQHISLLPVCIFLLPERISLPMECLMGHRKAMTYGPYYGAQYGKVSPPYGGRYSQPAYSPNYGL